MPARCCIFGILLLALVAVAARADTLYKPWDRNAGTIRQTFRENIPAPFLVPGRTVYVETVGADEMETAVRFHYPQHADVADTLRGLYLPRPRDGPANLPENGSLILMADLNDTEQFRRSLTHEYGHFVYCELANNDERARWRALWQRQSDQKTLPTTYAGENALEGFAESFRLYAGQKSLLPADTVAFFQKLGARLGSRRR